MSDPTPDSPKPDKPSFFAELKRRKVFRVAGTYAVVSWIIIQVANSTFEGFGIPEWAFRFVVIMLVLGFPVAILLAWAFELTPDGVKTTKVAREVETSASQDKKRNWFSLGFAALLPTVIFGALALYFYFGADDQSNEEVASSTTDSESTENQVLAPPPLVLPEEPEAEIPAAVLEKSIAVLPFTNRSELKSDEYFTDGIHDDLLTQISHIREIKTISRTSVMSYRGTTKNMKQIGEELGVATLLEGGVQRAGKQVRINMQLIDAKTDAHIWAKTYDRELTAENIFKIQSEIAQAIAKELRAVLSPEEKDRLEQLPTNNLEALEEYFKGQASDYSTEGLEVSIAHFLKAIELDPDFALAHARLAHTYQSQIWYSGLPFDQQVKKSEPHLKRAMELDPNLSEAWVVKALMDRERRNLEEAEAAYVKAIELNPNNDGAYINYSILLFWDFRRSIEALEMVNKGIELNPDDPNFYIHKGEILRNLDQRDHAALIWKKLDKRYPDDANVQMQIAENLWAIDGSHELAYKALRRAHFLDVENPNVIVRFLWLMYVLDDDSSLRF